MINIGILQYPYALKSAIYGWHEMFELCNLQNGPSFTVELVTEPDGAFYDVILIPPAALGHVPGSKQERVLQWLIHQNQQGSMVCSACAGAFLLAQTGLLNHQQATTHWELAEEFKRQFPDVELESDQLIVKSGNIVTAGGLMSWLDLGFEVVRQFKDEYSAIRLGKTLVIDTAPRQQRYYQEFTPRLSASDNLVQQAQRLMATSVSQDYGVEELAARLNCSARTLQRRFNSALGMSPNHYVHRLRVDSICQRLLSTRDAFETIAYEMGYEDVSACRKSFKSIVGLTPTAFRSRFLA